MQINVDEYRLQECRLPTKCSTSKNGQAGIQLSGRVYPACTRPGMWWSLTLRKSSHVSLCKNPSTAVRIHPGMAVHTWRPDPQEAKDSIWTQEFEASLSDTISSNPTRKNKNYHPQSRKTEIENYLRRHLNSSFLSARIAECTAIKEVWSESGGVKCL